MSETPPGCLGPADMRRLLNDLLDDEALAEAETHLEACADCRHRLDQLSGSGNFDSALLRTPEAAPLPPELLASARAISTETSGISDEEIRAYLEPAEDHELLGKVGSYEVTRLIAQGGMGLVLEANDPELARRVAIKLLAPELAVSAQARERFLREARSAAALEHENIMPVYAVDQTGVLPYLVMPAIDGGSLQEQLLEGEGLPVERIIHIATRVARALNAAHAEHIIHRDIKPANILLDAEGDRVLLADFGLALAAEDQRLTRSGALAGTPQYMAPELANDEPADERSDVWALGAVMYVMSTGKPAFTGKTLLAVVRNVAESTPIPPHQLNPDMPEWLSDLIMGCLEKNPDDRIGSAEELVRRLQESSAPPRPRRPLNPRILLAGLGVLAVLAWMVIPYMRDDAPPPAQAAAAGAWLQIAGDETRFDSLQAAVDAAVDGAVIELYGDELTAAPTKIEGKFLTFRPAPGQQPYLMLLASDGHLIETDRPLILEGLAITNNVAWDPPEVIFSTGAALFISNCRISRSGISNRNPRRPALIRTVDAPHIDLQRNQVFASQSGLILNDHVTSNQAARVVLSGNAVAVNNLYMTRQDVPCPTELNIHSNSFVCTQIFSFRPGDPRAVHKFYTSANCFEFTHALLWLPLGDWNFTTSMIKWQGNHNLYALTGRMVSFDQRVRKSAPPRKRMQMWEGIKSWRITDARETEISRLTFLEEKRNHPEQIVPEDYLPPEEYRAQNIGPRAELIGPGANYEAFRMTEAYRAWSAEARRVCEAH